jgi:NADH-quinone oxidoreductase subunit L
VARPALAPAIAARARPLTTLFENKWYFDELIDALVVRPGAWFGRFAQNTFERVIVNGLLIGGSTGLVRAGSALVRGTQSGILRVYAGLMLVGIAGVGLYFLLQS